MKKQKIFKGIGIIIICILASAPLSFLAHEGWHFIYGQFYEHKEPRYICFNPYAYTDGENIGLFFMMSDLKNPDIKASDYFKATQIYFDEFIATLILMIIMFLLSFKFLKLMDGI